MKRFSILEYYHMLEAEQNEQMEQDETQNAPRVAPVDDSSQEASAQMPPETPPQNVKSPVSQQSKGALRDVVGSTISDISYEPVGANGGKIVLKLANTHVPLVISWVGTKVSASKPNGTVIMLSKEEA